MKKLLVPCDFSKTAINAFRVALDLAARSKGSVDLLHVIELPILSDAVLMPVLNFEKALFKELKEKTQTKFESLLSKYTKAGVKVTTQIQFGAPAPVITKYAQKQKADLVIMGTHGAAGLREIFIGSNAEKIVRQSTIPVLVVKNYTKAEVKNIVFPTIAETENEKKLIEKVKELQAFFKAKLHIVRINTPTNFASDTKTREELNAFAKTYGLKNYTINIFNELNPEYGILEFSKLVKGELIAMATHGRKGLGHLFNGSNTEDVVNHANRIIWTYNIQK